MDSHLEIQPPWLISYAAISEPISTPRRVPTRSAAAGGPSTTIVAIRKLRTVLLHGKSGIARVHVGTRCNPVKAAPAAGATVSCHRPVPAASRFWARRDARPKGGVLSPAGGRTKQQLHCNITLFLTPGVTPIV